MIGRVAYKAVLESWRQVKANRSIVCEDQPGAFEVKLSNLERLTPLKSLSGVTASF